MNWTARAAGASGGNTQENAMNREQVNRRNLSRQRPLMVEPLEGRQLMSVTPVPAPSPVGMQNIIITSVIQPTQPPSAGVAILSPVYF
jgi:hypothetical protein